MKDVSANTLVIAIVVLTVVGIAFVGGLSISKSLTSESTPFVTTVLAGLATTIAALIALIRADSAATQTKAQEGQINELHTAVQDGLQRVALTAAKEARDPLDDEEHRKRLLEFLKEAGIAK